jgi:hypothetical protein
VRRLIIEYFSSIAVRFRKESFSDDIIEWIRVHSSELSKFEGDKWFDFSIALPPKQASTGIQFSLALMQKAIETVTTQAQVGTRSLGVK